MNVTLENMQLVMWDKVDMPDRIKNPTTGEWTKTGTTVEKTRYYLRDEFGNKLVFLAGNEYRDLEGSTVILNLEINYNEYQNKNEVKLTGIEQIA